MSDAETPAVVPPGLVGATWVGPYIADMGPLHPPVLPGEKFVTTADIAESDHCLAAQADIDAAHAHFGTFPIGQDPNARLAEDPRTAAEPTAEEQAAARAEADKARADAEARAAATGGTSESSGGSKTTGSGGN